MEHHGPNSCKVWKPETGFPAKHQQRRCSFFRVCLTCEVTKPCHRCGKRQPEANFGAAAWKARNADRRVCKQCATKCRGCWQCATCSQHLPVQSFTTWQARRFAQNGRQQCNQCMALAFACRYVHATNVRLKRTRQRWLEARRVKVLEEVRMEIARRVAARPPAAAKFLQATAATCPRDEASGTVRPDDRKRKRNEDSACAQGGGWQRQKQQTAAVDANATSTAATNHAKPGTRLYYYICPSCNAPVRSSVRTGQVDHRRRCGHRFPVQDGQLVTQRYVYVCPFCKGQVHSNITNGQIDHRTVCNNQFYIKDGCVHATTRQYAHSCPVCQAVVWSSRACGRIQSKHDTPAGKRCPQKEWQVPKQQGRAQKKRKKQ